MKLNYNHKFRPIWAAVPALNGTASGSGTTASGSFKPIGVDTRQFNFVVDGPAGGSAQTRVEPYWTGDQVRTINVVQTSQTTGYRYTLINGDQWILPGAKFTLLAIFKPTGDGTGGDSDARLFSKDTGTGEIDHDLMIGLVRGSVTSFRTRVRVGTATQTLFTNTANEPVQNDAWNMVAVNVIQEGVNTRLTLYGLREDGTIYTNSRLDAGSYNPNNHEIALMGNYGTGGVAANLFYGSLLGVFMFASKLDKAELKSMFANPWQVFTPRRMYVPLIKPTTVEQAYVPQTRTASGAATIAALLASGTANIGGAIEASGNPSLTPSTSSGAATVHRAASGSTTLAPATATGTSTVHRAASGSATAAPATAVGSTILHRIASGAASMAPAGAAGTVTLRRQASGAATVVPATAAGTAERTSVKITDVNTTETWNDGQSGIVITGSGFL